jgi:hypothetical protein
VLDSCIGLDKKELKEGVPLHTLESLKLIMVLQRLETTYGIIGVKGMDL